MTQAPSIQQNKVDNIAAKSKDSFCKNSSHLARLVEETHPMSNRFVTAFNKLRNATSRARQVAHQDVD
jgi:hypothetical protein